MDALKSGAIFRLKNFGVVRSPPTVQVIKTGSLNSNSNKQKSPGDNDQVVPTEATVIKKRFDEIYRATPQVPASILLGDRGSDYDYGNQQIVQSSSSFQHREMGYHEYAAPSSHYNHTSRYSQQHYEDTLHKPVQPPLLSAGASTYSNTYNSEMNSTDNLEVITDTKNDFNVDLSNNQEVTSCANDDCNIDLSDNHEVTTDTNDDSNVDLSNNQEVTSCANNDCNIDLSDNHEVTTDTNDDSHVDLSNNQEVTSYANDDYNIDLSDNLEVTTDTNDDSNVDLNDTVSNDDSGKKKHIDSSSSSKISKSSPKQDLISSSSDTNSTCVSRISSRGRLCGSNTLMNLNNFKTETAPSSLSSNATPLSRKSVSKKSVITESNKKIKAPIGMIFKSVTTSASKKDRLASSDDIDEEEEIEGRNDGKRKFSDFSGLMDTQIEGHESGKKAIPESSPSPYWKEEAPQRYGTLTLVPMSSLVTKNSNSSSSSSSRVRKRKKSTYYNSNDDDSYDDADSDDNKKTTVSKYQARSAENDNGSNLSDENDVPIKINRNRLRKGRSSVPKGNFPTVKESKQLEVNELSIFADPTTQIIADPKTDANADEKQIPVLEIVAEIPAEAGASLKHIEAPVAENTGKKTRTRRVNVRIQDQETGKIKHAAAGLVYKKGNIGKGMKEPLEIKKSSAITKGGAMCTSKEGGAGVGAVSDWTSEEMIALYAAHPETEAFAPDFWHQVSENMNRRKVHRSAEDCQAKWFQSLGEAEKRRKYKARTSKSKEGPDDKRIQSSSTHRLPVDACTEGDMTINHLHKDSIALKEITHGASNLSASNVGAEQKKKRMRRADIQQLAEVASRSDKADDIFEYQRERGACVLVKGDGKKPTGLSFGSSSLPKSVEDYDSVEDSDCNSSNAMSRGNDAATHPRSGKGESLELIGDYSDLRSPQALTAQTIDADDLLNGTVRKGGKKNNKASYVHNLSKKVLQSSNSSIDTHGLSASIISKGKGGIGKSLDVKKTAFNTKSKKIMSAVDTILSPTSKGEKTCDDREVEEESPEPDDYNRNMSEDEDGDF